nr:hypothetical protein [Flavobacterium gelatinilyticum]
MEKQSLAIKDIFADYVEKPALVKLTFALLMQRNLNQSLKNMLRVA